MAYVGLDVAVQSLMNIQTRSLREALEAHVTGKWLLPRVCSYMNTKIANFTENLSTYPANMGKIFLFRPLHHYQFRFLSLINL